MELDLHGMRVRTGCVGHEDPLPDVDEVLVPGRPVEERLHEGPVQTVTCRVRQPFSYRSNRVDRNSLFEALMLFLTRLFFLSTNLICFHDFKVITLTRTAQSHTFVISRHFHLIFQNLYL